MKNIIKSVSYIGLLLTLIPSLLVFAGSIDLDSGKILMLVGTIIWFLSAPSWMNKTN